MMVRSTLMRTKIQCAGVLVGALGAFGEVGAAFADGVADGGLDVGGGEEDAGLDGLVQAQKSVLVVTLLSCCCCT